MATDWPLALTLDARGSDMIRVRPRGTANARPHLMVRTGPLVVYCLDGPAVTSVAAAWALAHASSAHLLPQRPGAPAGDPFAPIASAAGDAVLEGRQRWDVIAPRPGQPFALVTSDWLTIRVHDLPALETHTRAWATACALGSRFLKTAPAPFGQLLRTARDLEVARQHRSPPLREGRHR